MSPKNRRNVTVAGCIISFSIAAFFLGDVSVSSIVNVQNVFLKSALIESVGASTIESLNILLSHFYSIILSLIFLAVAFSFLAAYNYYSEDRKTSLLLSLIGALIFIAFLGITPATVFMGIGILLSGWFISPLAHTYGKELKKWKHFRVGSNATGRAMMLLNVFIAMGVFFAVLGNLGFYQDDFRNDLKTSISSVIEQQLPAGISEAQVDVIIEKQIDDSPLFEAYIRWLPVTSAFMLWVLLEFMRLIIPNIAGAFISLLINIYSRKDSHSL